MAGLGLLKKTGLVILAGYGFGTLVGRGLVLADLGPTRDEQLLEGATPVVENITEIVTRNGIESSSTTLSCCRVPASAKKYEYL